MTRRQRFQRAVSAMAPSIMAETPPSRCAWRWNAAPFPRASTAASSSVTTAVSPASSSASRTCSTSWLATAQAGRQSGRRADQVVVQTGPAGPPGGQAQQFDAPGRRDLAGPPPAGLGFHQRPRQRGDQHCVIGVQAHVRDPDLQCRIVLRQTSVEVHHAAIQQRAGADHLLHRVLVGLGGAEGVGRSRGRPAAPRLVPETGVLTVTPLPERRVRAERQQDSQPGPDPVEHGDPLVGRGDLDVHMAAAGELLMGGQPERAGHGQVPALADQLRYDRDG